MNTQPLPGANAGLAGPAAGLAAANTPLRFACSNIAWGAGADEAEVFDLLQCVGITGIELAPTVVWPGWQGATAAAARSYAHALADRGLQIPSLQALLFGCPDALLFGPHGTAHFERQLALCAELGQALGARVAVLGAPRQRQRGGLAPEQAAAQAAAPLRRAAARCADAGMVLAIEPARPEDGGDFLTTTTEVMQFVQDHGGRGLGVHLDAAALFLAGESLPDLGPVSQFAHYQLSEPGLGPFVATRAPQTANLAWLQQQGWPHWCSVEMRSSPLGLRAAGPWPLIQPFLKPAT